MSFGQEVQEFIAAFSAGRDLVKSPDEREALQLEREKDRASLDYMRAQTGAIKGEYKDATRNPLDDDYKRSLIALNNANAANVGKVPPLDAKDQASIGKTEAETAQILYDLQAANRTRDAAGKAVGGRAIADNQTRTVTPAGKPTTAISPDSTGAIPFNPQDKLGGPAIDAVNKMGEGGTVIVNGNEYPATPATVGLAGALAFTGADSAGNTAIDDGSSASRIDAYLEGAGAAPSSLVSEINNLIDPNGVYTDGRRNLMALGAAFDYHTANGEPEKAKDVAIAMIQSYRKSASQYLAFSQAAAEKGDIPRTAEALMRAYASIPDGNNLQVIENDDGKYTVRLENSNGETIEKDILTPKEVAAMALQISPADFDGYIMAAAGEEYTPPAVGLVKPEDRNRIRDQVDEEVAAIKESYQDLPAGEEIPETVFRQVAAGAEEIMIANGGGTETPAVNANTAMRISWDIVNNVNPEDPMTATYSVMAPPKGSPYAKEYSIVVMDEDTPAPTAALVPNTILARLETQRLEKATALQQRTEEAKATKKTWDDNISEAAGLFKRGIDGVVNFPYELGRATKQGLEGPSNEPPNEPIEGATPTEQKNLGLRKALLTQYNKMKDEVGEEQAMEWLDSKMKSFGLE